MELIIWKIACSALLIVLAVIGFVYLKINKTNDLLSEYDEKLQDELLKYALANPNPVLGVNKSGYVIFSNHGADKILTAWGVSTDEKIPPEWREIMKQIALSNKAQTLELNLEHEDYLLSIVPRRDGSFSLFAMDITELKELAEALEDRILNDEHTKLPNRVSFKQSLERYVKVAVSTNSPLSLLIIRLDDYFQVVNSHGDDTARTLILTLADRLSKYLSKGSILSRLSDNQFAVLELQNNTPNKMAIYVKEILDLCTAPYHIKNRDIYIVISIGIAFCPNDGNTADILTRNAQLAVNRTSRTRNAYEFFQRGMDEQLQLRRSLITDLRNALAENQFELYYQPQIDLRKKTLIGCEALVRWKHPTKGYIPPIAFIGTAEESNLIESIGEWTLREACKQINLWQKQKISPFRVSVNLSGRQILRTDIISTLHEIMNETHVTPEWFGLELTETALVQNKDQAQTLLNGLKNLGIEIALDDFGTGYSSLSYLMQFPIDKLKIDRSFISPIENENEEYVVTKGIIDLAHKMKLDVVAEGVETPAQLKYMYKNECSIIQGYIFGHPLEASKFLDFIHANWKKEIEKYIK